MPITERVQLLGNYQSIPKVLTISSLDTSKDMSLVGEEDYDSMLLFRVIPELVQEKVDLSELLEIDFRWLCRCIRILSYGSIHTTNSIFCNDCGKTSYGDYKVNLNTVICKPLPSLFDNQIILHKDEFIELTDIIIMKLPTIAQVLDAVADKRFDHRSIAEFCYSVLSINNKVMTDPAEVLQYLSQYVSVADYWIMKELYFHLSDYGLRSGGRTQCPHCNKNTGVFVALPDDRFFSRPWELNGNGRTISVHGKDTTYQEVRQQLYENIIDETLFISRASEGAVSAEWLMTQPIFIRKKYVESFTKELSEREKRLNSKSKSK